MALKHGRSEPLSRRPGGAGVILSQWRLSRWAAAPLLPRRLTASRLELADVARDRQFALLTYRVRAQTG
jgi:hypothetical protein